MNAVDLADQYRAAYADKRRQFRTWQPLFQFMLQTSITNALKLWVARGHCSIKSSASHKFRIQLANSLLSYTKAQHKEQPPITIQEVCRSILSRNKNECFGQREKLKGPERPCIICSAKGIQARSQYKRRVLQDLPISQSNAKPRRPPRTQFGCNRCNVRVCSSPVCWEEHMLLSL